MFNISGEPIAWQSHFKECESVKGKKAAYRVRDTQESDLRNFIFDIGSDKISEEPYFSFGVGYQITERLVKVLNPDTEKIDLVRHRADEMRYTRGVFLPRIGVTAFRDGSGDDIGAVGGIGRTAAILEQFSDVVLDFELTARQEDVDRAVDRLRLMEMRFEVRPFNPHPRNPGLVLSGLMEKAKVGNLNAVAKPYEGGALSPESGGVVSEVRGLSDASYGHFGITATTKEGATVVYKKRKLSGDREKDQAADEKPRLMLISVERTDLWDEGEVKRIAQALIELYGAG